MTIKESYNTNDWKLREDYYATKAIEMNLPDRITTTEIKKFASEIDSLLTEASLDLGFCKRKYESVNTMRKYTEKQLFFYIKQNGDTFGVKTINEIDGAVAISLKVIPMADVVNDVAWENNKQRIQQILTDSVIDPPKTSGPTILSALRTIEDRLIFMQHLVEILKDKQGTLITLEGALKLEANISRQAM